VAVYGKWLAQFGGLDSTLLESLLKDCPNLHALSRDFWDSYNELDIVCFYENEEAAYGPLRTRVCLCVSIIWCYPLTAAVRGRSVS
jgi:hypothetical protein